MSRIELGGWGPPIPLPEDGLENAEDDLNKLPLTYILPDGTIFKAADYLAFGYTHYEVAVIGAAGGEGGGIGATEPGYAVTGTKKASFGGGGGGGGLHVVHGRLDELPEEVLVTVGQAGADGIDGNGGDHYGGLSWPNKGQGGFPSEYTAIFWEQVLPNHLPYAQAGAPKAPYTRIIAPNGHEDSYVYLPMFERLPQHTQVRDDGSVVDWFFPFIDPTDGVDGGASKFGEVAMASGGKGGKKSPYYSIRRNLPGWVGPGGPGGDGGIGGSDVAGGGAAGANNGPQNPGNYLTNQENWDWQLTPSENGSWDGTVGEGGGGGRGGALGSY